MAEGIIKASYDLDQTAGKSIQLKYSGIVGYANNTNAPTVTLPLPFVAKNTNYSVTIDRWTIDGVGAVSNPAVSVKNVNSVSLTGTATSTYQQTYGMSVTITITFA